ncbi:hypothetical protein M0812_18388 [Anaeramoeba flamelloides]|uniref:Uncharacterized protein n=1 Tax=Anaeramoeba flamelloides TaxID=1746091 RepID=A0AAV7Z5R9_9EUKA|nr:hypothetical protein M0812_18388 [Anaeramoeba flamelloides]|eukprot:Anaeramoba_flamelloidesa813551_43.p1 GENE.a813551_43~~a813551_43.p1  ORF type:complete len:266 (-),score=17.52 a813551_43:110-907(-)
MCWCFEASLSAFIVGVVVALIWGLYFKEWITLPFVLSYLQMQLTDAVLWLQNSECNKTNQITMFIGMTLLWSQPFWLIICLRYTGPKENRLRLQFPFWYALAFWVLFTFSTTLGTFFPEQFPGHTTSTEIFAGKISCGFKGPMGHLMWESPRRHGGEWYPSNYVYISLFFGSFFFHQPIQRGIFHFMWFFISHWVTFYKANFTNESGSFWCFVIAIQAAFKILIIIFDFIYKKITKNHNQFIWKYIAFPRSENLQYKDRKQQKNK